MNISRQLRDIQVQADKLLTGNPTMNEIVDFDNYNEEMKSFLAKHLKDEKLLSRVKTIPSVLEEESTNSISSSLLATVLLFLVSWAVVYFIERQKINSALSNIHVVKGKYSSIEFLSRNIK